jgi:hypothetical protein
MRRGGEGGLIVLIAAGLVLAGCSFALTARAPPREQWPAEVTYDQQLKSCTASPIFPIVDGAITVGLGVGAIYAGRGGGDAAPVLAGIVALPALVYLASALYGVAAMNTCRNYLAGAAL